MPDSEYFPKTTDHISAGASAAKSLAEACERAFERSPSLQLEVVRDLARDLERQMDGLSGAVRENGVSEFLAEAAAEAAQRCGDLATLAACNAEFLDSFDDASGVVRLAEEAAQSLSRFLDDCPDFVRRDLNSAVWKASLAIRQIGESPEKG